MDIIIRKYGEVFLAQVSGKMDSKDVESFNNTLWGFIEKWESVINLYIDMSGVDDIDLNVDKKVADSLEECFHILSPKLRNISGSFKIKANENVRKALEKAGLAIYTEWYDDFTKEILRLKR